MTIHKAKGLEFDSVVLPELQMWLSRPPAIIFSRDPETLRINAVSSYPSRVVQALEPRLAAMYEDYTDQEIRESLCLLYVAMTRARQSLTLIVPALKAKQDGSAGKAPFALSSIVRAGLAGDSALTDLGMPEVLYEHGDCAWYRKPPEREKHDATPAVEMVIPKIDLTGMPLRVRRQITPSSLVDEPADLATEQARRRGIALHAMLAQVAWAGDPLPGDENLLGAARRAAPASSGSELDTCLPVFHALITKPAVQQALSRPILAAGEQIALWRERDFAQIVAGDLVAGTFDRAALVSHNGVLSRATIYDFKTMDCQPSELPALAERYRPQVEMYRAALSAMTGLPLERIAAEIVFTAAGECIPV